MFKLNQCISYSYKHTNNVWVSTPTLNINSSLSMLSAQNTRCFTITHAPTPVKPENFHAKGERCCWNSRKKRWVFTRWWKSGLKIWSRMKFSMVTETSTPFNSPGKSRLILSKGVTKPNIWSMEEAAYRKISHRWLRLSTVLCISVTYSGNEWVGILFFLIYCPTWHSRKDR